MRLAQRIGETTLHIEQRYHDDSWQVRASSIDVRVLFDLGRHVIAGPHGRFHAQTGATFQQRVYHATIAPQVAVPIFRTIDRELSPLVSVTGGRAVWWRITDGSTPARAVGELDRATYEALVQPVVERRCGSHDCHGKRPRGLRVYGSSGSSRSAPARSPRARPAHRRGERTR